MAGLHIPSVQHLARNWRSEPEFIANQLVRLVHNPPRFNYNSLYGAVRDMLILNANYEDIVKGVSREKRDSVRKNLLEVLPLLKSHFEGVAPDFYQSIAKRYYPIGRGLMVPFDSPMIYGIGGQLYFPWFSFWRSNPLSGEGLSLFVTIIDEILMQDPDLDSARFEVLDFSCPYRTKSRKLNVINSVDIARLSERRKREMLECFAEGYFRAKAALAGESSAAGAVGETEVHNRDPRQPGLFD